MQGRVFRRRGKRWAYTVDVGADPATGRRRQQSKGGFATKAEAEKELRKLLTSVEHGTYVGPAPTTLAEYLEGWLVTTKPRLRETTWYSYELAVKRVTAELGAVKLQALTPRQVETCYARLMATGGQRGRPLAPKTVRNVTSCCTGRSATPNGSASCLATQRTRRRRQRPSGATW